MLATEGASGVALARRHSKIMDGLLSALYPAAYATIQHQRRWIPVLLGAVGGYGRELLGWKSDLDVRLLTTEAPEQIQPIAEAILYPLWDAGVSIGHQVMTIGDAVDAARDDLPTATALLDFRPIAGDESAARMLEERVFSGVFSEGELPAFMERLEKEVTHRHRRFGDSVYLLEPDVRNGAGGLRDLDIALWAARARFRTKDLQDLVRVGVLVAREAEALKTAVDFLWTLRNHLHRNAGRRSDRLTFEEQERIAGILGYRERVGAAIGAPDFEVSGAMVEAFMSDYYRHARVITRAREQIVARATPRLSHRRPHEEDLGHGLRSFDGQLTLADPSAVATDPAIVLRLYAAAVARHLPVLPFAREVVTRAVSEPSFGVALRASPEAAALFVGLVSTARETRFKNGSILAELHDVGLLLAMIPEFSPLVGRVHHDVYHVYTVDVHSVAAVDHLRALVRGDVAKERPLACRLAAEMSRPSVVFLATLLHDVGKAIGGKDHSQRGAEMARDILTRLGLPPEDVEEGCHLIFQHLVMYLVAARRDIDDPATIEEFAREVHGRGGLRDLYLLTVVDLTTTSPTSMTKWKSNMLDELFLATDAMLSGNAGGDQEWVVRVRAQVKEHWNGGANAVFLDEYLATMPERYLLSNTPAEIAAHARVALEGRNTSVSAAFVPSRHPGVAELCVVTGDDASHAELCVVTGDRPGLLAAIAAAIAASRLEVHAAQIHTRQLPDGSVQAVDLFWVLDRSDGDEVVESSLPKLEADLRRVIAGAVSPRDLVSQRGRSRWSDRPSPSVSTAIVIDHRASLRHTVIEVLTKDRPGLLFALAQALHELGLTIAVAKINTEGTRVADVFYVTEMDGKKLHHGARTDEVRERLLAMLGKMV
jgi:[protein-PII] uridylyltransferase